MAVSKNTKYGSVAPDTHVFAAAIVIADAVMMAKLRPKALLERRPDLNTPLIIRIESFLLITEKSLARTTNAPLAFCSSGDLSALDPRGYQRARLNFGIILLTVVLCRQSRRERLSHCSDHSWLRRSPHKSRCSLEYLPVTRLGSKWFRLASYRQ